MRTKEVEWDGLPIPKRYWAILAIAMGITVSGRHDCQRGITVYRGGFAGDTVYVDLDRECLPVGDRGFLAVLVFAG